MIIYNVAQVFLNGRPEGWCSYVMANAVLNGGHTLYPWSGFIIVTSIWNCSTLYFFRDLEVQDGPEVSDSWKFVADASAQSLRGDYYWKLGSGIVWPFLAGCHVRPHNCVLTFHYSPQQK